MRPALVAIDLLYRLQDPDDYVPVRFGADVLSERWIMNGLIFSARARMNLPWNDVCYCFDACLFGVAVSEERFGADVARQCGQPLERWLFEPPLPLSTR